jgi:SNF family Na+-dependent transporter
MQHDFFSTNKAAVSPAEEFFERYVLEKSDTLVLDGFGGGLNMKLVISYFVAWLLTALALCKGVKIIGKLSYVTATVPYIICFILFCRSIILEGAREGIDFYLLKPDFSIVFKPTVGVIATTI